MGPFLIFYPNFGPYQLARLNALARVYSEFAAVEMSPNQILYPWTRARTHLAFPHRVIFQEPYERICHQKDQSKTISLLNEMSPSGIMIVGYREKVMRTIASWASNRHVPTVMTTDTTLLDRKRYWHKELVKKVWIKTHYEALFLPGGRSASYFTRLGFTADKIWLGASVVDNDFFEDRSQSVRKRERDERSRLDLPDRYFFTVARLSPEKNITALLKAFSSYRKQGGHWSLVIAGSGPQEEELKKVTVDQSISAVHFIGWKQYGDLPAYYALASCFILPSISEPWGLVVNEAMACGLPVLVSRKCGCQPDLCHRGVNGYDFDPYNTDQLTKLMLRCSCGGMDLVAMGKQSLKIIANYTPETWALSVKDCILTCLDKTTRLTVQGLHDHC